MNVVGDRWGGEFGKCIIEFLLIIFYLYIYIYTVIVIVINSP